MQVETNAYLSSQPNKRAKSTHLKESVYLHSQLFAFRIPREKLIKVTSFLV
jgi:hypothetical protein